MLAPPWAESRVEAVAALLAGAAAEPLPDADRARVPVIIEALAVRVDADLRAHILSRLDDACPQELRARLERPNDGRALRHVLGRTNVPPGVAATALARVEMFRLMDAVRIEHAQPAGPVSPRRSALLASEARRVDGFGEPTLEFDDLPAEAAHALVWTVAAGLRAELQGAGLAQAEADGLAVASARARLDAFDEEAGLYAAAARLADDLAAAGALDDDLIVDLLDAGELTALAACLGRRAGVSALAAWPVLVQAGGGRLALLLRAAEVARPAAARVLLRFLAVHDDPLAELDVHGRCEPEDARKAVAVLGHDPVYRAALRGLGVPS